MNWTFCNTTGEYERIEEKPLWRDLEFHHFGLILSAAFGAFSIVVSLILVFQHATHYSKPTEQKHILRILFMIPIYSFVSFLSYYYYKHTIYFEVIRDCYEAFAIASFFALLCHYVAPDLHEQKEYFRTLRPTPWIWPVSWMVKCTGGKKGLFRTPRSGLTWFNVIWFCVFQYCFIRVAMTIVAVITQATDRYCLDSLSPAFAHVWVMVIEATSVTFAMVCLIQFYVQLRHDIAEHQPLLKVLAIKLVVFLVFWQTIIINFLTSSDVIKPSPKIAMPDVKIGIPAMLICLEMAIFSILHLWAYPWKVYTVTHIAATSGGLGTDSPHSKSGYKGGAMGIKAFLDAFNPWDMIKAIGRGFRWIIVGRRFREHDVSYKHHLQQAGTALQAPVTNKPGKYHRLDEQSLDGSGAHVQDHSTQLGYVAPQDGDLGVPANSYGQSGYSYETANEPVRHREDGRFDAAPMNEDSLPQHYTPYHADTTYHGVQNPSHPESSGRTTYGQPQPGHTGYGVAYGGPAQAEMPDPNRWTHAR